MYGGMACSAQCSRSIQRFLNGPGYEAICWVTFFSASRASHGSQECLGIIRCADCNRALCYALLCCAVLLSGHALYDEELLQAAAVPLATNIPTYSPASVANALMACAALGFTTPSLSVAAAQTVLSGIQEQGFKPRQVALSVFALAKLHAYDQQLLDATAAAFEREAQGYSPPLLSMLTWVCVLSKQRLPEGFVQQLVRRSRQQLSGFSANQVRHPGTALCAKDTGISYASDVWCEWLLAAIEGFGGMTEMGNLDRRCSSRSVVLTSPMCDGMHALPGFVCVTFCTWTEICPAWCALVMRSFCWSCALTLVLLGPCCLLQQLASLLRGLLAMPAQQDTNTLLLLSEAHTLLPEKLPGISTNVLTELIKSLGKQLRRVQQQQEHDSAQLAGRLEQHVSDGVASAEGNNTSSSRSGSSSASRALQQQQPGGQQEALLGMLQDCVAEWSKPARVAQLTHWQAMSVEGVLQACGQESLVAVAAQVSSCATGTTCWQQVAQLSIGSPRKQTADAAPMQRLPSGR